MALNTTDRIKALREGGWTDRMHTVLKQRRYEVSSHSWNIINLILVLFEDEASLNLIKAAQWHDVAERWVGDTPWPAKYPLSQGRLARELKVVEEKIENVLGIAVELTEREQEILRFCDMLELCCWANEELELGNKHMSATYHTGLKALARMDMAKERDEELRYLLFGNVAGTQDSEWWKELLDV